MKLGEKSYKLNNNKNKGNSTNIYSISMPGTVPVTLAT